MTKMLHPIVKQLAKERRARKIHILALEKRTGYSRSMLEKLECGHRRPSFVALTVLASTLGYEIVLRRKSQLDKVKVKATETKTRKEIRYGTSG